MSNITLWGAVYDTDYVDLPKSGGGLARFSEGEPSVLTTKNITLNGSYSAQDDSADGYSAVTVNVQNGASMTEVQNTYGTELVITSAQSAAPSATRHTLYFEYEDESTETEYAYYDDAFIGSAITATTPTTHNNKTVTSAQLDGVEWYSYTPATGTWETVFEDSANVVGSENDSYFWITGLGNISISDGSKWRITCDGVERTHTAYYSNNQYIQNVAVGAETLDADSMPIDCPYIFWNSNGEAWIGFTTFALATTHSFKVEREVSA